MRGARIWPVGALLSLAPAPGAAEGATAMAVALPGAAAAALAVTLASLALRRIGRLKRRAARLAAREAALEMALDTVSTAIVAFDREGRIELMNAAARRLLGVPALTPLPAPWPTHAAFRSAHPADGAPRSPLEELGAGRSVRGAEFLLRIGDAAAEVRVRAAAEPAAPGAPIAAVLTLEDVTEEHRARVVGDRTDRLDALGKLTGGVAHDFNNLLSTIMGALQLAQRRSGDDPRIARHLDAALRATRTGAALVERLLGFAKRGSATLEDVGVAELFAEAAPLAETVLDPSVRLTIEPPPPELAVRCDRAQIVTALLNLVSNARDAIASADRRGAIVLSAAAAEGRAEAIEICVRDDGPGMTPEVMAHALDPFFTTKGPAHGTGLGLSMVYGAIRRCGGDMRIDSAPGAGAAVRLWLPRSRLAAATKAPAATPAHGVGRAVLLVDDEVDLLDTAEAMLVELGYAPIRAADAETALREIASARVIDLVLTDVALPGELSGIDVARAARAARPGAPILFASGFAERDEAAIAALGAPLLRKPYSIETLSAALSATLRSRRKSGAI